MSVTIRGFQRSLKALVVFQLSQNWWVVSLPLEIGRSTYFTEDFHGTFSLFGDTDCYGEERRKIKPVRQSSNTNESFWKWPGGRRASWWLHSSTEGTLCYSLETRPRCSIMGTIIRSAGSRIGILANEFICNHDLCYDTWRLYWSCDLSRRRPSKLGKAWNSKTGT